MKFTLYNAQQGHQAMRELWDKAKPLLMAGHRLVMEMRQETRSDKQNKMLHAMLGDISRQVEWAGKRRDADTWKRLLTAAWLRGRGESIEVLPALDGCGVDVVFRHTSKLTKAECAELCDYIGAWCAENGVELTDFETGEIT